MGLKDTIKHSIKNWLEIEEIDNLNIKINNELDFVSNAAKNTIWYRGDANELQQFYAALKSKRRIEDIKFWGAAPSTGMEIQKRHTGIPGTIVDTLTEIVAADLYGFTFEDNVREAEWSEILEANNDDNNFMKMVKRAISCAQYIGDGAFKISISTDVSDQPIIEFWSGEKIDFTFRRGRVDEIIFKSIKYQDLKKYELHEIYGYGYIRYKLLYEDKEVPINTVESLANMQSVTFGGAEIDEEGNLVKRGDYMMAVPVINGNSNRWDGRGQSWFDRKVDNFDSLDEIWSQWMDAVRSGRSKTYIPSNLIPRDPESGRLKKPNSFDNRFISINADMSEGAQNRIVTDAPVIQYDAYMAAYITALDLCLQGIISPSTLGIDTKKLDNAEAQREKEKTTLYSRQKLVDLVSEVLPRLINTACHVRATMNSQEFADFNVTVNFGEYANPSFESQIETIGKGRMQGVLSIEAAVEELYGDSKDDKWKKEEIEKLKAESGAVEMTEPAVNFDIDGLNE